jgi:magnesium transporter
MLVNCVAYREGVRLGDVPVAEVGRYLGQPGHLVWMGLMATPRLPA